MVILIVVTSLVVAGIGTGIFISKKRINKKISDVEHKTYSQLVLDNSILEEMNRFEQLKINLVEVKRSIEQLDIPVPENITSLDSTESSLNKLSRFFEKHSKSSVGTEAFILSILPVSQTGEALCSFASVLPNEISKVFEESVAALKNGASIPGIDDIYECLGKFCNGISNMNPHSIAQALGHHDYFGVISKSIKGGVMEMTGINDALGTFSNSMHDMTSSLSLSVESNIDPTDLTDLDFSGHIPVLTIAISSFREFNLLVDDKTDAMTSLKNVCLDAAGAGGGGLLGAKTGALVGSAFGPIGTLLGGIVGGIGGAVGGRSLTNNIKRRPLKNAIEEYQSSVSCMKYEASNKSRSMLESIRKYTIEKRKDFKEDKLLKEIPVVDNDNIVINISLIVYQSIYEYVQKIKNDAIRIKSSLWYSEKKYGTVISNYEFIISEIEHQLPVIDDIYENPKMSLEKLLNLKMPLEESEPIYVKRILECSNELKVMNDKNNSSILMWSYMVNGLYNKTLNDIADFSNLQMKDFERFMTSWKQKIKALEIKVNREKEKLGLK